MFKIIMLMTFIFSFSLVQAKERVTGRSPAIVLSEEEVFRVLNVSDKKSAIEVINAELKKHLKDSALRNRFLLYSDSLNLSESAPRRVQIYHEDTLDKKWNRFKTRLARGFDLKTIIELSFIFLLGYSFIYRARNSKSTEKKNVFKNNVFSDQPYLAFSKVIGKSKAQEIKVKLLTIFKNIQMEDNQNDFSLIAFSYNTDRVFGTILLPDNFSLAQQKSLTESVTKNIKVSGARFQYWQSDMGKILIVSLEYQTQVPRHIEV